MRKSWAPIALIAGGLLLGAVGAASAGRGSRDGYGRYQYSRSYQYYPADWSYGRDRGYDYTYDRYGRGYGYGRDKRGYAWDRNDRRAWDQQRREEARRDRRAEDREAARERRDRERDHARWERSRSWDRGWYGYRD